MLHEKSCGAVVFRRADHKIYILMIRHKPGGHRSFPKGHMEKNETEYLTAIREVTEETGVQPVLRSDFRETVHYHPMAGVDKEVVYFLSETYQTRIRPREGEIAEVEWVDSETVDRTLLYENDRTVYRAAKKKIDAILAAPPRVRRRRGPLARRYFATGAAKEYLEKKPRGFFFVFEALPRGEVGGALNAPGSEDCFKLFFGGAEG